MKAVGVKSLDDLVDRTVPHSIRLDEVRPLLLHVNIVQGCNGTRLHVRHAFLAKSTRRSQKKKILPFAEFKK